MIDDMSVLHSARARCNRYAWQAVNRGAAALLRNQQKIQKITHNAAL